jgi:GT2 family glycosyltransferase
MDAGAALDGNAFSPCRFVRVEHYGKGAPPQTPQFTRSRPVPAVSGAFMSTNRAWFERVGGFSEDYVFGHYEDADLCLKSLDGGVVPWLHDLRMWHLEGRGSVRLPAHEGGSIVNRWLFSRTWGERIDDELRGPDPKLPIARMPCNDADSANDDGATGQPRSEARV